MASIYGLTLKALKKFTGHDGEPCYQGNLYLGTKKIGFWTEDGRGGSGIYRMDPPYREGKLNVRVKELHAKYHPEDTEYYDLDCLMQESYLFWMMRNSSKKHQKKDMQAP